MVRPAQFREAGPEEKTNMLTLNETFAAPDADHAWSVVNDLDTLVSCVPGARVKSVDGPQAVKAEIEVRMGAGHDVHRPRHDRVDRRRHPHRHDQGQHARNAWPELRDRRHHDPHCRR
jgi:hypothetical protein